MEQELIILGIETKIELLLNELLNNKKVLGTFDTTKIEELQTLAKLYDRFKYGIEEKKVK